jgi:hypothetical protein
MLAGLIQLSARRAGATPRESAADGSWPKLLAQAADRTGGAPKLVFLALVAGALLLASVLLSWSLAAAALFALVVRIGQFLVWGSRP